MIEPPHFFEVSMDLNLRLDVPDILRKIRSGRRMDKPIVTVSNNSIFCLNDSASELISQFNNVMGKSYYGGYEVSSCMRRNSIIIESKFKVNTNIGEFEMKHRIMDHSNWQNKFRPDFEYNPIIKIGFSKDRIKQMIVPKPASVNDIQVFTNGSSLRKFLWSFLGSSALKLSEVLIPRIQNDISSREFREKVKSVYIDQCKSIARKSLRNFSECDSDFVLRMVRETLARRIIQS